MKASINTRDFILNLCRISQYLKLIKTMIKDLNYNKILNHVDIC